MSRRLVTSILVLAAACGDPASVLAGHASSRPHAKDARHLPAPPDVARLPRPPRGRAALVRQVRRALAVPDEWSGAPPLPLIPVRAHDHAALEPLERKLGDPLDAPALAGAHFAYANALASRGYDAAAAAEYLEAVALAPTMTAAWQDLGSLVRNAQGKERRPDLLWRHTPEWDFDLAEKLFLLVLRMEPGDGLAHFNLALVHDLRGEFAEADAYYLRALELDPSLWLPNRNPLIVGNTRATRALHYLYLKNRGAGGGLHLDTDPSLAPLVLVEPAPEVVEAPPPAPPAPGAGP